MTTTIAVLANKGGTGKTTTTVNLAGILSESGKKTCIIDLDQQGSASVCYNMQPDDFKTTIFDVLLAEDEVQRKELLNKTTFKINRNLSIIPGNSNLMYFDLRVFTQPSKYGNYPQNLGLLKETIKILKKKFDYIIIDTIPSFGLMMWNVLVAADKALIVFDTAYLSMRPTIKLCSYIREFEVDHNTEIDILGVLCNRFDRKSVSKSSVEYIRNILDGSVKVFDTIIFERADVEKSPAFKGMPAVFSNQEIHKSFEDFMKEAKLIG